MKPSSILRIVALVLLMLTESVSSQPADLDRRAETGAPPSLVPTLHPALPAHPWQMWLAPEHARSGGAAAAPAPMGRFVRGVQAYAAGNYTDALPLIDESALSETLLDDYAAYYLALTQFRLGKLVEARRGFSVLGARSLVGYLSEAATLREAEAAEALGERLAAMRLYERALAGKPEKPDEVLFRFAKLAVDLGETGRAADAYRRVYYEFPLSDLSPVAGVELEKLPRRESAAERVTLDLNRALRLFGSKRYTEARTGLELVRPLVTAADDKELIDLRLAECDFYLGRYRSAADGMRPYLEKASRRAEARFFYLTSIRESGDVSGFIDRTRQLARDFPDSSWTEEALNNLGTHYIRANEDDDAADVFRELYEKFPTGAKAERAAWRTGWWAYKNGNFDRAASVFEGAAATMPRADSRPAFLYWAGRARDRAGETGTANERYGLTVTDYGNSYYGRLAANLLRERRVRVEDLALGGSENVGSSVGAESIHAAGASSPSPAWNTDAPPSEPLIRQLLSLQLYDDALNELRYAQRTWGDSAPLQATIAWVYYRRGDLRPAIIQMKRAYPQFLTGNTELPVEILKVVFPLDYWDSIKRHAAAHKLDPYLVGALIAQESTFMASVRSAANAYGLMQIIPGTGRRLARELGIRGFTTSMLVDPETNLRLGTAYFARLVKQFGGTHFALAGYNAGEHRVERWIAERPGLERDEFIDDIPFPETQNYVKKILGTADDYRRIYGQLGATPDPGRPSAAGASQPAPHVKAAKTTAAKKTVTKKRTTAAPKTIVKKRARPRR
jgi:soluble lytic murein transglycosylase